jgi:hypothetical protein
MEKLLKKIVPLGPFFALFILSGCAHYLTFPPSTLLREDGAVWVHLGNGGHKIVPFFSFLPHTFEPEANQFDLGTNAQVQVLTTMLQTSDKSWVLAPSLKYAPQLTNVSAQISGAITNTQQTSGKYVLTVLQPNTLIPILNAQTNALYHLYEWGDDARVITAVAIAYSFTNNQTLDANLNLSGTYDTVTGSLSLSDANNVTYNLSDGTVFAYQMSHVCWTLNNDKLPTIEDFVVDNPGIQSEPCPPPFDPNEMKVKVNQLLNQLPQTK